MKYLLLIIASLTLSLTSCAQQGLGWWSVTKIPGTETCNTYRVTRNGLLPAGYNSILTYVDCHNVKYELELEFDLDEMSVAICSSVVPTLVTNAPAPDLPWGEFIFNSSGVIYWDGTGQIPGTAGAILEIPQTAITSWWPGTSFRPGIETVIVRLTTHPSGTIGNLPQHSNLHHYFAGNWMPVQDYSSPLNLSYPAVVDYSGKLWYTKRTIMPGAIAPSNPGPYSAGTVQFLTDGCNPNWVPPPPFPTDVEPTTPVIPCGGGVSYNGGRAFPSDNIYTVGSGTGNMEFFFNAWQVPDKYILIKADGVNRGQVIHDTGYRGDWDLQPYLDDALGSRGLPHETITGGGKGTVNIPKTSDYTQILIRVYAPLDNTGWYFSLSCP